MLQTFKQFVASDALGTRYDVCVAGAGVAGITLARELANAGKRVLLLEGGDVDFTTESQDLYQGDIVGRDYFELDVARLRYLGGTSNHWAGFCRPLDSFDFEARPDIDGSGWPISRDDLDPWLAPAADILEIKNPFPKDVPIDDDDGNLRHVTIQLSPPVRFGEKYLKELKESQRITLVVNANVVDIQLIDGLQAVQSLAVAGYDQPGERIQVMADSFVLALGGIENARALLNANNQIPVGVGNEKELVGRYFMEHFELDVGHVLLNASMDDMFGDRLWVDDRVGRAVSYAVNRKFMHTMGTLNCELRLSENEAAEERTFSRSLKSRLKEMVCGSGILLDMATYLDEGFKQSKCLLVHEDDKLDINQFDAFIRVTCEQAPNPESRIKLADDKDRFGLRKTALDWRLLDVDKETLKESAIELGQSFIANDIGRIRVADWLLDDQAGIAGLPEGERAAGFHHIGTTRMGHGPQDGVVDRDGRVFGIENLYVTGSSLFTTGGHVPPTFTIVQMALRLADHLADSSS